jgi:hypothetical protein
MWWLGFVSGMPAPQFGEESSWVRVSKLVQGSSCYCVSFRLMWDVFAYTLRYLCLSPGVRFIHEDQWPLLHVVEVWCQGWNRRSDSCLILVLHSTWLKILNKHKQPQLGCTVPDRNLKEPLPEPKFKTLPVPKWARLQAWGLGRMYTKFSRRLSLRSESNIKIFRKEVGCEADCILYLRTSGGPFWRRNEV